MIRYDRKFHLLAFGFATLAGFVDAIGFMKSGGLFVSFMTGNSTRLAIGAAEAAPVALAAAGLVALFVGGVVLGVMATAGRKNRKALAAGLVALLLALAALGETLGGEWAVLPALCLAMGAANTIFQRDGDVSIGLTYMTGNLVRLGHRLAAALRGGERAGWVPYLLLWLSLVTGGILGALSFARSGAGALWIATAAAVVLAILVQRATAPLLRV
ncbi:conserved hypothetical protein [Altererythrobacter sp. B11]|uniref:YoaK family protein n=1 Tax=Altererythrobacter sp. B11 TaxID=2060312 RepID=UPI000DC71262|nr:YoaK family protein [Altererythrobacter sp. B11]BBC72586.1 conserved hypothetical protein [Altererythrobacter sp. B11]